MELDDPVPPAGAIAAAFGLTGAVGTLAPVGGAWSNRVFRLVVGGEAYAAKELRNPWDLADLPGRLDEAWRVELGAIAAGVPAPAPVPNPATGAWGAEVEVEGGGVATVRLHRWVDGTAVPRRPVSFELAGWCGRVLAAIHGLALQPQRPELFPAWGTGSLDRWPAVLEEVRRAGVPWVEPAVAVTPVLVEVAARYAAAESLPTLMGHRDVDQKNLLLTAAGPALCDWDVAGPTPPMVELADVAVSMARWEAPDVAREVVDAYRRAGGSDEPVTTAHLAPVLRSAADWLVLNVERAVGLRGTADERALGAQLAPELLTALPERLDAARRIESFLAG